MTHLRHHQRAPLWALAALTAVCAACPAAAQARRAAGSSASARGQAGATGSMVVATVNGEKITRDQVFNEMLGNEMGRLDATNPVFRDLTQLPAAQFDTLVRAGQLVMKRLNGGPGPVSVSRADVMRSVFEAKGRLVVDTVQNMIRERAVAQAAAAARISTPEATVDQRLREFIDTQWRVRLRMQGKSDAQVLASLGIVPAALRRFIRFSILVDKLTQYDLEKKVGHPLGPNDYVEVSHLIITVRPQASAPASPTGMPAQPTQADIDQAYEKAKPDILKAIDEVKSGKKTFAQEAGEVNTDETKFRQGKIGIMLRGQMDPVLDKVAFSLPKGQMSEPIRTARGWEVLMVDHTGADMTAPERATALKAYIEGQVQRAQEVAAILARAKITNTVPPAAMPRLPAPG